MKIFGFRLGRRPMETRAPEEAVFDVLDSTSDCFLVVVQQYMPRLFKSDGKWSLTDRHDLLRWRCQNGVTLFEIRAYMLFILCGVLLSSEQTDTVRKTSVDFCVVKIAEKLVQRACLDPTEIEEVSGIVEHRVHAYQSCGTKSPTKMWLAFFLEPLQFPSVLWNDIHASIGKTSASLHPGVHLDLIDYFDSNEMVAWQAMRGQLAKLVQDFVVRLQQAFAGTNDYRLKGCDELRRLLRPDS